MPLANDNVQSMDSCFKDMDQDYFLDKDNGVQQQQKILKENYWNFAMNVNTSFLLAKCNNETY
ncbi:hypothetical protein DERF_013345 [Dermatophagoides farinae]|uniref:Uncharacterized protein n=1 Tax=Dermatophagoides farinae TaxID=6954 RepID=A0A922HLS2_DERFA|nr:hypothetical protein DERF_013345 [Dermatophagoides farinae]